MNLFWKIKIHCSINVELHKPFIFYLSINSSTIFFILFCAVCLSRPLRWHWGTQAGPWLWSSCSSCSPAFLCPSVTSTPCWKSAPPSTSPPRRAPAPRCTASCTPSVTPPISWTPTHIRPPVRKTGFVPGLPSCRWATSSTGSFHSRRRRKGKKKRRKTRECEGDIQADQILDCDEKRREQYRLKWEQSVTVGVFSVRTIICFISLFKNLCQ